MEIASSIAGKITDCLVDVAGREVSYLFHYNDNIATLKKQATKLTDARDRIQGEIDVARRNGEIIEADVQHWTAEANNIYEKAEKFLDEEVEANKSCLKGWCINLKERYQFSKEAKQRTLAISHLLEDKEFRSVSRPAPPPGIVSSYTVFSGTFESRKSILKKVMKALNDDNVYVIGICGMGGVGKTTMVKEISKHAQDAKLYDAVVMAVVTQTPSIFKIQGEIADMLGLKLSTNFESTRAGSLRERIKNEKRILIILDDVWKRIELDDIGIPFRNDHRGCQILITSRSRTVCNQMDCQEIFTVETLSEQESWELFREIAGSDVENSDINPIAREVAAKCGGLPIAIVTVARALKDKNKRVWSNAARQLSKSTPTDIPGMEAHVFSSLELSFSFLDNVVAKCLFLFCSLFPEDWNIPVEDLVRYGMGLRWFKDMDETIEEIRDTVHAIVSNIISSFLLIGGKDFVKMHDVVRDFALMVAPKYNQMFLVKAGLRLQDWPIRDSYEDLTCISLMINDIKEVPDGLECPNLQCLLLQSNNRMVFPNNSFLGMKDLKVLDLSETQLLQMPDSFSSLANLRTLNLSYCKLGDFSVIGKLIKLEILGLSNSSIEEIPTSLGQLSYLRLLDLNYCEKLTVIPHGVISRLGKLEELYMIYNSFQWDSEGVSRSAAKLAEFQSLSRLTSLHVCIPNVDLFLNDIPFQNLSNFTLIIGHVKNRSWNTSQYSRNMCFSVTRIPKSLDWIEQLLERTENLFLNESTNSENVLHGLSYNNLERIMICQDLTLIQIFHGESPVQSFKKIKFIEVDECNSLLNIAPSNVLQRLHNLEHVSAFRCGSLVNIFDCEELEIANGETKILSSLNYLHLRYMPEMSHVWKGEHQSITLHNLKQVRIFLCRKLIKLFSPPLLQSLTCLEGIDIQICDNLEEIFEKREAEDQEKVKKLDQITTSPSLGNLTDVRIYLCPKVKKPLQLLHCQKPGEAPKT